MITFTKFGSCVTSDIFNFMNISNYYPQYTHTGINIRTAVYEADIPILEKDIVAENGFGIRMQKYCFQHKPFAEYSNSLKSDYFIFDLCDERLPLQKWCCKGESIDIPVTWNTYRTSQNLSQESYEKYGGISISDWHFADRNRESYIKEIKKYCESIKKLYPEDRIIYISLRQADFALKQDGKLVVPIDELKKTGVSDLARRKRENQIIDFAESIVKQELKNCWIVNTPDSLIADARHHFGIHPLHFHYLVYEYIAECVSMIADSSKIKNISEDILRKK